MALSEVLKLEMGFEETKVRVSLLCPGPANTGIIESLRNRLVHLENPPGNMPVINSEMQKMIEQVKLAFKVGMDPVGLADYVFKAIGRDQFFNLTHPGLNPMIEKRMGRILTGSVPQPEFTLSNLPDQLKDLL